MRYAGILCVAFSCLGKEAVEQLYKLETRERLRAEIREMQAASRQEEICKRLGEKKYLIRQGVRVVMVDMEIGAGERIISRELVRRIEQEATDCLRERERKIKY